jgi:hypothetical protein
MLRGKEQAMRRAASCGLAAMAKEEAFPWKNVQVRYSFLESKPWRKKHGIKPALMKAMDGAGVVDGRHVLFKWILPKATAGLLADVDGADNSAVNELEARLAAEVRCKRDGKHEPPDVALARIQKRLGKIVDVEDP